MADFELFIGYLGNGATVCNKAVQENGDYKTVAHVSNCGNIKLYVQPSYIPDAEMKKIEEVAKRHKTETEARLDKELNGGDYFYGRVLDECCNYTPSTMWLELLNNLQDKEHGEKVKLIKEYYMKNF